MLSYKHIFHAGNFADVLKHMVLQSILQYLGKKEAPYCLIDTHAGAGAYALQNPQAQKNQEFNNGIAKLWQAKEMPEAVAAYVNMIKQYNPGTRLTHYPGSPAIMQHYLRGEDRLFLFELHSNEFELLAGNIKPDRHIKLAQEEGLQAAMKLLPPTERRGLVFIDPSYEIKADYTQVIKNVKLMHQRFATGTYAIWYPVVERERNQGMEQSLRQSGIRNIQLFELGIQRDNAEHGMTASGLLIINPPWTLKQEMALALPWLATHLGYPGMGNYRCEQLVTE